MFVPFTKRAATLLLLALLSCGHAYAQSATGSKEAAEYYEDALIRFEAGDYTSATIQLKNALQLEPDHLVARLLLGRTYLRLADGPSAEKEIRLARQGNADAALVLIPLAKAYYIQGKYEAIISEISPGDDFAELEVDIRVLRGRAFLRLGNTDRAEGEFTAAGVIDPNDPAPMLGKARVLLRRGDREAAEALADRASTLAPQDADTWHLKAEIRRLYRDYETAVKHYERAVALQPLHMPARVGRAATLIDLKRDESALADIDFVLEHIPNDAQVTYLKALVLARAGDTTGARDVLGAAADSLAGLPHEFLQGHAPSLFLFGMINYLQEDYAEAYEHLSSFLRLYPNHVAARKITGKVLIKLDETLAAVETIEPLLQLRPDDAGVRALLGEAYLKRGRLGEAAEKFEEAAELAPDNPSIRTRVARSRIALGQHDRALEDLEAALAIDPDHTMANLVLARVMLKLGRYEEAIATAKRVAELDPENAEAYNIAGGIQFKTGNLEAARAAFEKAIELASSNASAKLNLAKLARSQGQPDEAKERYEAILAEDSSEIRAMVGLSELAQTEGRINDAIGWREKIRATHRSAVKEVLPVVNLYLQNGEPRSAMSVVKDLETRQPRNLSVLLALARVEIELDEHQDAKVTLARTARFAGHVAPWLHRVAQYQMQLEDFDAAHWSLYKATTGDPDFLPAQKDLVSVEIEMGRLDKALEHASGVRDARPDDAMGHVLVGDVLSAMGRYRDAVTAYELALARDKRTATVIRLYETKRKLEPLDVALLVLEDWRHTHVEDLVVQQALASAYMDLERLEAAATEYQYLLIRFPQSAGILNNLAWIYLKTGDSRAADYAARAYELAPEEAAVLDTFGWVLVREGSSEQGLSYLRKAFLRASKEPAIRYHLGVALNSLGRKKAARAELEAALESGREFEGSQEARDLLRLLSEG